MRASISRTRTFYANIATLGNFGAVAANGKKKLIIPIDLFYCFSLTKAR